MSLLRLPKLRSIELNSSSKQLEEKSPSSELFVSNSSYDDVLQRAEINVKRRLEIVRKLKELKSRKRHVTIETRPQSLIDIVIYSRWIFSFAHYYI